MSDATVTKPTETDLKTIGTMAMSSGSPKAMYVYFLLSLMKTFYEESRGGDDAGIDRACATLLTFVPSREKQIELLIFYAEEKQKHENAFTAATLAVGLMVAYLAEVLELEEKSYGGVL